MHSIKGIIIFPKNKLEIFSRSACGYVPEKSGAQPTTLVGATQPSVGLSVVSWGGGSHTLGGGVLIFKIALFVEPLSCLI